MPILIIGWNVFDKLPEKVQKEFALVERYRTDYLYECYEYDNSKGNKNYDWSDRYRKLRLNNSMLSWLLFAEGLFVVLVGKPIVELIIYNSHKI